MKTGDKVNHKIYSWAVNMETLSENTPGNILCVFQIEGHPVFAEFKQEDLQKIDYLPLSKTNIFN